MKIVQVLDYYASGNAVANCAVTYHKFSKKLGLDSKIVARLIDKEDADVVDLSYLDTLSIDDTIMYHLCIGTPLNNDICDYECKKVLVYHNITPPEFLEKYDQGLSEACAEGLRQLVMMKPYFQLYLADSEFNRQDLIKAGYEADKIVVIPPLVSRKDLERLPDSDIMNKYGDDWTNILFVGRVSPHKKHEDLIRIFNYYKRNINSKSRLILAGGVMENYCRNLEKFAKELELEDVIFTRQISFSQLLALYKTASIFLCTSEHEGYCIPLIEAMIFGIPVIGYNAGAIGDTMGGSGILLEDKSPVLVAKIINELENNGEIREHLLERQNAYLEKITEEEIFAMFKGWIGKLSEIKDVSTKIQNPVVIEEDCAPYDVVVAIKSSDWNTAKLNFKYIRKNLKPKRIVVISSKQLRSYLRPEDNVVFIDEDRLYEGMSFRSVKEFFENHNLPVSLTGWFLQQFLKLAYAFICEDDYYLTWDADTIPLNPVSMLSEATGKPYFDMKPEYVETYFDTIQKLLQLEKVEDESFISEHMLFQAKVVKELLHKIEQNDAVLGNKFFEKILYASDFSRQGNVFSEFETYGTFCSYYYPDLYEKHHLNSFRGGKMFLGENPSEEVLDWVSKCKDLISFEVPQEVISKGVTMSSDKKFREKYTFNEFVERIYLLDSVKKNAWLQSEEAVLVMDYPWAKEPEYKQSRKYQKMISGRECRANKKILIFQPDLETCALAVILAAEGFPVMLYDTAGILDQAIKQNSFVGIKALKENDGLETLVIVKEIEKDKNFSYAIVNSQYAEEFDHLSEGKTILTENVIFTGAGFSKELWESLGKLKVNGILMDISFIDKYALLNNKTRLYIYSDNVKSVEELQRILAVGYKTEYISQSEEFIKISEKAKLLVAGTRQLKSQLLSGDEQLQLIFGDVKI